MSEVDNFISSVKEKRTEAIEWFNKTTDDNGGIFPIDQLSTGIDSLVGGILDAVEEHHAEFITAETESGEEVIISCASDLSTLYFEEVSN